jgi:hypothetical protein
VAISKFSFPANFNTDPSALFLASKPLQTLVIWNLAAQLGLKTASSMWSPHRKGNDVFPYEAKQPSTWVALSFDVWSLYLDAMTVVGLRTVKMAAGGTASDREARLMITEKMASAFQIGLAAATGSLGHSPQDAIDMTLRHYGRKIRANKKRLSQSR